MKEERKGKGGSKRGAGKEEGYSDGAVAIMCIFFTSSSKSTSESINLLFKNEPCKRTKG